MAKLPGRYIRSKNGSTVAYVIATKKRHERTGEKLYGLRYKPSNVRSGGLFTLAELNDMGVKWFKREPKPKPKR